MNEKKTNACQLVDEDAGVSVDISIDWSLPIDTIVERHLKPAAIALQQRVSPTWTPEIIRQRREAGLPTLPPNG